jgi:SAM-dependent methyltransferase
MENPFFSSWNPHFTPPWLSERVAGFLSTDFAGTVVDPACGAGNLLIAASLRLAARRNRRGEFRIAGMDVSKRAVKDCESALGQLLPRHSFSVVQGDFLAAHTLSMTGPVAVVMNPPFKGYGKLSARKRSDLANRFHLSGRFNLSHVFVRQAIELYKPVKLVAVLPSNWVYSRSTSFRSELASLNGKWDWEHIGDAFAGLGVDVGILTWRPFRDQRYRSQPVRPTVRIRHAIGVDSIDVRHGTATGSDASFMEIAKSCLPSGRVVSAVRGRDIGRQTSSPIWVPPVLADDDVRTIKRLVSHTAIETLAKRSCVRTGRRGQFDYHESVPKWFLGFPKVLLPEIVSGDLRVEVDPSGVKLPLHSVIAIRVPSAAVGESLKAYFASRAGKRRLLRGAPRLSGGAIRLQVDAVRDAINSFISSGEHRSSRLGA